MWRLSIFSPQGSSRAAGHETTEKRKSPKAICDQLSAAGNTITPLDDRLVGLSRWSVTLLLASPPSFSVKRIHRFTASPLHRITDYHSVLSL
jgi:hypothetical protein